MTHNDSRKRIVFCVTGLRVGGAETSLVTLVQGLMKDFDVTVVCLDRENILASVLREKGVQVVELGLPQPPSPSTQPLGAVLLGWMKFLAGLVKFSLVDLFGFVVRMRRAKPNFIQGWMYHGNILAHVLGVWCPRARVLVSVRQSLPDIKNEKWLTRWIIRLDARLARYTDAVIYNAHAARDDHEKLGYPAAKSVILYNGFDVHRFCPDDGAHGRLCEAVAIPPTSFIIGLVARFHPMKDHATFIEAAALMAQRCESVHFVMVGKDVNPSNPALGAMVRPHAFLAGRLHYLGVRRDMPSITAGFDVATSSSSRSEGMPNVVCEAMACGVPCVVTDVGDGRRLVEDVGLCVPARDPHALMDAWSKLLLMTKAERQALGARGRERIEKNYSTAAMVRDYGGVLASLCPSNQVRK